MGEKLKDNTPLLAEVLRLQAELSELKAANAQMARELRILKASRARRKADRAASDGLREAPAIMEAAGGGESMPTLSPRRLTLVGADAAFDRKPKQPNRKKPSERSPRHKAHHALRESEERYRLLTEHSMVGTFVHQDGRAVYANEMLASILGLPAKEILGRPFLEFVHPEDRSSVEAYFAARYSGGGAPSEYDFRIIRADGQTRWVLALVGPTEFSGRPAGIGNIADITERKEVEAALRESRAKYKELAELLPHIVYEIDLNGNFVFVNRSGLERGGYTIDDIERSLKPLDVVSPEHRDMLLEYQKKIIKGERPGEIEFLVRKKDGGTIPVVNYGVPIIHEGKVVGTRGVCVNISELRQVEQELRARLKEKDVLLREIHHRVNNNLQMVCSLLRLRSRSFAEKAWVEMLREMENRVMAMAMVHERLCSTKNLAVVDLKPYVEGLVAHLLGSCCSNGRLPEVRTQIEELSVAMETAIPLGIIIAELVSAAAKQFAGDGASCVMKLGLISERKGTMELTFGSSGSTLGLGACNGSSFGLRLVRMCAEQLHGRIEMNFDQGTNIRIRFKEIARSGME